MRKRLIITIVLVSAAWAGSSSALQSGNDEDYVVLKQPVRTTGPTVTQIDNNPVDLYGDLCVYSVSPDYQPTNEIQAGNTNAREKIRPKKSWQIKNNYFGVAARLTDGGFPSRYSFSSPHGRDELSLPIHLIDGDATTFWMIPRDGPYEAPMRDAPAEIRVDLPQESTIKQVNMVTMSHGALEQAVTIPSMGGIPKPEQLYYNPMPRKLEILLSRDGHHWDTVYKTENLVRTYLEETLQCPFLPQQAKQIILRGSDFGPFIDPSLGAGMVGIFFGRTWAFSELEVIDDKGNNVALVSHGSGITVNLGPQQSWDFGVMNDVSLAARYDLGIKWMRANYWGGNLLWHHVEQEKGKYVIDPQSDLAISEAAKNGVNVLLGLMYGNWLYANPSRPNFANRFEPIPFDPPPAPKTREQIEAFKNWARFMVNHFKERVKWWEIWNEPNSNVERYGWGDDDAGANQFKEFVEEVVPVIRSADPRAKVLISAPVWHTPGWQRVAFSLGRIVDGMDVQRVYEVSLDSDSYRSLPDRIRSIESRASAEGFRGRFMSLENQWFPEPNPSQWLPGQIKPTDIGQAKNLARLMLQNAALGVITIWQGGFQMESGTLAPAYYAYRTLCSIMDGAEPADAEVRLSGRDRIDRYAFRLPDGSLMVALWLPGDPVDNHPGHGIDLTLPSVRAARVLGTDVLNGTQQPLNFTLEPAGTVVPGLIVRDYPLVLRIENQK